MSKNATDRPAAVLVAVQLSTVANLDHEADMARLGRLVNTLGYDVVATVSQRRSHVSKGAVLGEGKLRVLAEITGGPGPSGMRFKKPGTKRDEEDDEEHEEAPESAPGEDDGDDGAGVVHATKTPTLVVVDHDLSPSQLRNLEKCTGIEVLDRSGVIIEIFHRHARSREARLEVEIARLNYVAPRMRESSGGGDRQRGRGAGESTGADRRKIRDRIAELRREIEGIQREHACWRLPRGEPPYVLQPILPALNEIRPAGLDRLLDHFGIGEGIVRRRKYVEELARGKGHDILMMRHDARHFVSDVVPPLLIEQKSLCPETIGLFLPSFRAEPIIPGQRLDARRCVRMSARCGQMGQQPDRLARRFVDEFQALAGGRRQMDRPIEEGECERGRR